MQTEKSGTLGTGNDQTIFCIKGNAVDRDTAQNGKWYQEDKCFTLDATDRHGVCAEVSCLNPWDAQSARVYDQEGAWHSLNANENGGMARDSVLCAYSFDSLASNSMKSKNPNSGCREAEIAKTLDTTNPDPSKNQGGIAVVALDMTHACDVIRECGEQVPALQARMGTGGNQVPLTYSRQAIGEYKESSTGSTCSARDFKDSTDLAITNMVVRRLTPMECERLQGFPDHWTDIGEWIDEKGKKHKDADSPRYKALGNSIALPFWDWMLRRMARDLPVDATLGSLFDGIAGFPLIWQRIHGKGTARWASEIEQFPIAVTKKHFPEEK